MGGGGDDSVNAMMAQYMYRGGVFYRRRETFPTTSMTNLKQVRGNKPKYSIVCIGHSFVTTIHYDQYKQQSAQYMQHKKVALSSTGALLHTVLYIQYITQYSIFNISHSTLYSIHCTVLYTQYITQYSILNTSQYSIFNTLHIDGTWQCKHQNV